MKKILSKKAIFALGLGFSIAALPTVAEVCGESWVCTTARGCVIVKVQFC